jgi:hypothetical protein
MAVDLSDAKGSLKGTAEELGLTLQILNRWRKACCRAWRSSSSRLRVSIVKGENDLTKLLIYFVKINPKDAGLRGIDN